MRTKNILEVIHGVFQKAKLPYVLIGGYAVNFYKVTRQTVDIDLLIAAEACENIVSFFKDYGYDVSDRNEVFLRLTSNRRPLMDIDILLVDSQTLAGIIKESREVKMGGIALKIPSLNHLIALKLHSIRQNQSVREYKDLLDVVELMKVNHVDFKGRQFKNLCSTYGSEEIYRKITNLLG